MNWVNIEKILSGFKNQTGVKNKLQFYTLKKILNKKFDLKEISFRNGKLELRVKNVAFANDLSFEKEKLKEELNKIFQENIIKEIIIKN